MKKRIFLFILLCITCISCIDYPNVTRLLTKEECAILPYHIGQQFYMVNQNNDTSLWIVQSDTISRQKHFGGFDNNAYSRYVEIYDMNNQSISIELYPEKCMNIWNNYKQYYIDISVTTPRTLILDNDTFNNVYVAAGNSNSQSIYYSIEEGIIRMQSDTDYLQLIR